MMESTWLWGILGLILLAAEMATGTIYILWFGISALIVSLILMIYPDLHVSLQFFIFAAFSLVSLAIWKIFYKKSAVNDLKIGQSQGDEVGRIGTIVEAVSPKKNGRIQFAQGVMGSREWAAIANEELEVGAEAEITAIIGNAVNVKRH
ncbi:MAG: NfeD family protein [Methylophilaceae bacterium]|nr:NfeD family protein [Methylophilaceae bacterium]